jgi:type IV pilus assembly protein PilC
MRTDESIRLRCYRWQGKDPNGSVEIGILYAEDRYEIVETLTKRQINISSIRRSYLPFHIGRNQANKVTHRDITLFTRQLATMLDAGLALSESLRLLAKNQTKESVQYLITSILKSIEAGLPLSLSLKSASPMFDSTYISLISYAEISGQLAATFERIAIQRDKLQAQRSKVVKAMLYPFFVIAIAFVITYLLLTMVIPEFEQMFLSFDAPLPWFTQKTLALSHWLTANVPLLLASATSTLILFKIVLLKVDRTRVLLSKIATMLPIFGSLILKSTLIQFSRTLSTAIRSGVPINQGLSKTYTLSRNAYLKNAFTNIYLDVSSGIPVYTAMNEHRCFPSLMVQLVMVGEQSGKLDEMLEKIANIYESELDATIDMMGVLIEPLLILFLGVVVGGLVVAIYLPIFNMMDVLG